MDLNWGILFMVHPALNLGGLKLERVRDKADWLYSITREHNFFSLYGNIFLFTFSKIPITREKKNKAQSAYASVPKKINK